MDRGYTSGYSWGGGGSGSRAGSSGFDMYGGGYKDSMSGLGGYGGGGGGGGGSGQMKRSLSGASMLSSSGTHADAVIAKINQRLDMLTQLEGGLKGTRSDRFDQYESFDSRTSSLASSRDLYRSGGSSYGYDGGRGDNLLLGQRAGSGFGGGMGLGGAGGGGGGFDSPSSSYGVAKMRQNMRDSFTSSQGGVSDGGAWGVWGGAGRRSPRRGGSAGGRGAGGGFGNLRPDSTPLVGGRGSGSGGQSHRGHSPGGGRGKLPSLLSNRMYPESGGFYQGSAQGPHDFPGRHFGGGPRAGRQRGRKRPLNKQQHQQQQQQQQQQHQVKPQRPDVQKKRKQMVTPADEPESKINKTESAGTEVNQEPAEKNGSASEPKTAAEATKPAGDTEGDKTATKQEEKKKPQGKQSPVQAQDKHPKMRKRRGFLERVMFACSVCKFRSFYKEDMETHLDSRFHKDHFKFLSGQLSKPTTDFLEEYLQNKFTKTDQRISQVENHSAAICQVYKEQDLTRELGMEHFMRKVEAAHCAACDLFIPMQQHLIQKHVKSADHNYNRKGMMEQSKRGSLSVARSILNHKLIGKKLESYLKGENPFTGNQDDQDPDDSMAMDVSELDLTSETADGQTADEQTADEQTADSQAAADKTADDKAADDQTADSKAADSQEADAQAADGQTAGVQTEEPAKGDAGKEAVKAEAVTEAAKEEKMEEDLGMGGEEGEQENQEEEDGFEVGEDDEGEEGYVVHDEIGEEALLGEDEDEGVEAAEVEEEENHK